MGLEAPQQTDPAQEASPVPEAAAVAPAQALQPAQFHPMLFNAHAAKNGKESLLSHMGLNFNLSSFMSFYPLLRFTGYTFEAGYSPANRALQRLHRKTMEKIIDREPLNWMEKTAQFCYGDTIPQTNINPYLKNRLSNREIDWGEGGGRKASGSPGKFDPHEYEDNYKTYFNKLESGVFTALAVVHSYDGYKQMKENLKLAVGTELGKDPKDVGFLDMRKSNNPIICSAVDRFSWQTPMRILGGAAFWKSLWTGIVANSLVISAERTVFYRPLAYDILSKAVNDVQINGLGQEAKGDVVDNLIRVMQAQRFDHRQKLIPREQMDALRPTLELIADDVINKRFGITGMMYIMGGGVLIPEDPAQTMENYRHVRDVGVSGVMEEARRIRDHNHVPSTKIWEARLAEQKGRGEDSIAESARRDELLRERRAILARGPLHAMPGSEIDANARYGGGIQMY